MHKVYVNYSIMPYSSAQNEGPGAETMGHSILAYQFVAGLTDKLKSKLVGCEGNVETLLAMARFEEAKLREVVTEPNGQQPAITSSGNKQHFDGQKQMRNTRKYATSKAESRCHCCGDIGHYDKECATKGLDSRCHSCGGTGHLREIVP